MKILVVMQQVNRLSEFKLKSVDVAKASNNEREFNLLDPKLSDLIMNSLNPNESLEEGRTRGCGNILG